MAAGIVVGVLARDPPKLWERKEIDASFVV